MSGKRKRSHVDSSKLMNKKKSRKSGHKEERKEKKREREKLKREKQKEVFEKKKQKQTKPKNSQENEEDEVNFKVEEEDFEFLQENPEYANFFGEKIEVSNKIDLDTIESNTKQPEQKKFIEKKRIKETYRKEQLKEIPENLDEKELELRLLEKKHIEEVLRKQKIASICATIQEEPEKYVTKIGKLHRYCFHPNPKIQKLAITSEGVLFKDILPMYRITPREEELETQKLSKEVKARWIFEKELTTRYQKYLKFLEDILKKNQSPKEYKLAVQMLCVLLESRPEFNFSSNIINTIGPLTNSDSDEVSALCCKAFTSIFASDLNGEITLEIVRFISDMIKTSNFNVRTEVLDLLLHLKLSEKLEEDFNLFDPPNKNKSKKKPGSKKSRLEKEVEEQMKEAEAVAAKEEKRMSQTEILKNVFLTYFRILKKAKTSKLLNSVLRGLGKYAHLINIEIVTDLLEAIRVLMKESEVKLSVSNKLQCISAAFHALKNQEVINVDQKDYYVELYRLIPSALYSKDPDVEKLVVECLELMFLGRKQLPSERCGSFLKRVSTCTLHCHPETTIALLSFIEKMFVKDPKLQQLLEDDTHGFGIYDPEIPDPEHTNPFATSLTEFPLLSKHYHPIISKYTRQIAKQQNETVIPYLDKSPLNLIQKYDSNKGTFNPAIRKPTLKQTKTKKSKRGSTVPADWNFSIAPKEIDFAPHFRAIRKYQKQRELDWMKQILHSWKAKKEKIVNSSK